jgi:hypothetical protein
MNFIKRFRRLAFASVLAAAVAAVAVAIALGAGPSSSNRPEHGAMLEATRVESASPAITAELSILNRPRAAEDNLPAGTAEGLIERRDGANVALAHRAAASPGGSPIYLIPSQRGVCMLNTAGTENLCANAEEVAHGEASAAILCAPRDLPTSVIEIGGILPDGTDAAKAVLSDASSASLRVSGNTYSADFPRSGPLPTSIQWSVGGRWHSAPTQVPAGVASENCVAPGR